MNFLITGTSRGIGRYLAERYLSQGHSVIGCSRGEGTITHDNYTHYICDATNEDEVVNMVLKIRSIIDVLINNAGVSSMNHSLLTSGEAAEKILKTNFLGVFYFSREVAKKMILKKKHGRIVNMTSVAVPLDIEGEMIYASSKAAVEKMTRIMSKELGRFLITVNNLGLNPINTDMIKCISKDKIQAVINRQAIKRIGEFEDVGNVVDFLISEGGSFITGQTLYLGGV